eukprot:1416013-Pleurochrysis_carterae.AAC.1
MHASAHAAARVHAHPYERDACMQVDDAHTISVRAAAGTALRFSFSGVGDALSQEEVFTRVARPIADACLDGYNGTIFAYGQTGALRHSASARARRESE